MTKPELKELFLKLTEWTIPFGREPKLEKYLPTGFKKDSIGNYYYEIGRSETLFTTHLDTYCTDHEKVNHVINKKDEYKISTDGTTILGGDNKLGCSILIGMINDRIPGTYYFFLGEEPLKSGGLYGSSNALKSNPEYFKRFKRCIAFDRRRYGSIVTRQMGRFCCSEEFTEKLSQDLKRFGIPHDESGAFGYYTDTATFMDVIPECTNLSAGGFDEHHKSEWVDLNYTWKVLQAAININWEELPTSRGSEERFSNKKDRSVGGYNSFIQDENADKIIDMLLLIGLLKTRDISNNDSQRITFSKWLENFDIDITLKGKNISMNGNDMTMQQFTDHVMKTLKNDILYQLKYAESDEEVEEILDIFGFNSPLELVKKLS